MSDEELFKIVNAKINKTITIDDEEIQVEAYEYIKSNKQKLINFFLEKKNTHKKIFFMAGSPGAGKSEMALTLQEKYNLDIIDTDEIRRICPRYNGKNSSLFQRASSRGVSILINESFKKEYSFILDGNFSDFDMQKNNIERALKRDYEIEIYYIYRPLIIAQEYTKIREEKEGRKVPDNIFYNKFLNSITTVNKIKKQYSNIKINFYNLYDDLVLKDINNLDEVISKSVIMKEDVQKAKDYLK